MSLSLDGATRETHDSFRGVQGTFDRTMEAVRKAHEVGLDLQINTTLTRSNLHEYEDFKKLMFELKPAMWSVFLLIPTGRAGVDELPDAADLERIFEDMSDLIGNAPFAVKTTEGHHFRRVVMQRKGAKEAKKRPGMKSPLGIRDGRGVMFISHTGEVSPSGFLPMVCGNVKETHPAEIYRNHPLVRLAARQRRARRQVRPVRIPRRLRRFALPRLRRLWRSLRRRSILRLHPEKSTTTHHHHTMINLTKLWTGVAQPADSLRYGHASGHPANHASNGSDSCMPVAARARKPITVWNITRTCNLRCVHCYSDSMAMQYPGELDLGADEKRRR